MGLTPPSFEQCSKKLHFSYGTASLTMSLPCFVKNVSSIAWIASKVERIPEDEVVTSESLADVGEGRPVKTFLYKLFAEGTIFGIGGLVLVEVREGSKVTMVVSMVDGGRVEKDLGLGSWVVLGSTG